MNDDLISRQAAINTLADWQDPAITNRLNNLAPAQEWIPVTERLPEENVYVLVWCGEVKIARIVYGISKEQRAKMKEGEIDDPSISWGWNLSNGYFKVKEVNRIDLVMKTVTTRSRIVGIAFMGECLGRM